ncbi:Phosphoenolpyruvate carboxylase 1 [Datura stramonium]|uniref:Phosphoenolpyruvate carboxylase 1 n=1 Tax=Datura stramonium TaxID=4076 RepID=A0ABS8RQ02_DATST|nr:Phosphoenolpyruvate carboxylase 1 [Datura stramonium]
MDLCLTQTRFHLPVWLEAFGAAFKYADKDIKNLLHGAEMYNAWPFFRVTIDLVEMVFAKGDPGIAALYDKLLVSEDLWSLVSFLRSKYEETRTLLLQIAGHKDLLEGDPHLKQCIRVMWIPHHDLKRVASLQFAKRIRDPNSLQVKLRPHISKEYMESKSAAELVTLNPTRMRSGLRHSYLDQKGIAAGMQNTAKHKEPRSPFSHFEYWKSINLVYKR